MTIQKITGTRIISQFIKDKLAAILGIRLAQGLFHNGIEVIKFLLLQPLLKLQLLLFPGLLFYEIQNLLVDLFTIHFVEGVGVGVIETSLFLLFNSLAFRHHKFIL